MNNTTNTNNRKTTNTAFLTIGLISNPAVMSAWRRIASYLKQSGCNAFEISNFKDLFELKQARGNRTDSNNVILCATIWQVFIARIATFHKDWKVAFWIQGLIAEESFIRNRSFTRKLLLEYLERKALQLSDYYIFASTEMQKHFEKNGIPNYSMRSFVIPCTSDVSAIAQTKRVKDSFCYIGGMSLWQLFPDTIRLMNLISQANSSAVFSIATRDLDACKKYINENSNSSLKDRITLTTLESRDDVSRFLSSHEFGLLLREDTPVNNVSSPIKLAEYLSCGVNVITTSAIRSYSSAIQDAGYIINLEKLRNDELALPFIYKGSQSAFQVYSRIFSDDAIVKTCVRFVDTIKNDNLHLS